MKSAVVVLGGLSPQLVLSRSTLTRPSSMTNYKAVRGADSSCSLSAANQGYAASKKNVGDRLSFDPLKQSIRQSVIAWASFE